MYLLAPCVKGGAVFEGVHRCEIVYVLFGQNLGNVPTAVNISLILIERKRKEGKERKKEEKEKTKKEEEISIQRTVII